MAEAMTTVGMADLEYDSAKKSREQLKRDFELASQRLADAQAELDSLKIEFQQFPERIIVAGGCFNQALHDFYKAREAMAACSEE